MQGNNDDNGFISRQVMGRKRYKGVWHHGEAKIETLNSGCLVD